MEIFGKLITNVHVRSFKINIRKANKTTKIDYNLPLSQLHYFDLTKTQRKLDLDQSIVKMVNKQSTNKFTNPSIYDSIKIYLLVL